MAGTKSGGLKASKTNREKYGDDFYRRIGRKGGHLGTTGGFAANSTLARLAGAKGGRISKRGTVYDKLMSIRRAIKAENVSMSEIVYLQNHQEQVKEIGDTLLAEWASIPEDEWLNR